MPDLNSFVIPRGRGEQTPIIVINHLTLRPEQRSRNLISTANHMYGFINNFPKRILISLEQKFIKFFYEGSNLKYVENFRVPPQ